MEREKRADAAAAPGRSCSRRHLHRLSHRGSSSPKKNRRKPAKASCAKSGLRSAAMPGSFRIEQTFAAATEPGEDLKTNLDARAPGFGAESVSAELAGDEWTVAATFNVDTREEAEARLGTLLEASGFPPSAMSSGATEIVDVTEE
jgi:hypothetical protein